MRGLPHKSPMCSLTLPDIFSLIGMNFETNYHQCSFSVLQPISQISQMLIIHVVPKEAAGTCSLLS